MPSFVSFSNCSEPETGGKGRELLFIDSSQNSNIYIENCVVIKKKKKEAKAYVPTIMESTLGMLLGENGQV